MRQVDTDGTFSFSPVATVQTEAGTKATLYPNPSVNQLMLPAGVGAVQYRVFNALGQAADNARLHISSRPKGPFLLELSGTTGHRTQRLLRKQRSTGIPRRDATPPCLVQRRFFSAAIF